MSGERCVGRSDIKPPIARFLERAVSDAGDGVAALIGLHLAEIANEEIYRLRAQYTTLILLSTLVQGTVVLMPQPMKILGFELLAINLWGLSFPVTLLPKRSRFRVHVVAGASWSVVRRSSLPDM
jgi:hypothetical protein